jgi:hypothetical protein
MQDTCRSRDTKQNTFFDEEGECNTEKSKKQKAKMAQTAGINMFVWSCGIIFSFFEMYGAESATHICVHILKIFGNRSSGINFFKTWSIFFFGYDDHCHLW